MTDKDKGQTDQKSFMQKHHNKHVPCYKCGNKGHYANKCPDGDNDDEASTRSSPSKKRVGWNALDGVASMMVSHYSKREA
jgi:hypothetical protein